MARKIARITNTMIVRTPIDTAARPTPFATLSAVMGAETVAGSTGVTAPPYGTAGGGDAGSLTGEVCTTASPVAEVRSQRGVWLPRRWLRCEGVLRLSLEAG